MVWFTQMVEFIQSVEFSTPQQYSSACIKSNPCNIGGEIAKINIIIDYFTLNPSFPRFVHTVESGVHSSGEIWKYLCCIGKGENAEK